MRILIVGLCLGLLACGGGKKAEELRLEISQSRANLKKLEELVTPDNVEATQILGEARQDLEKAELLLIEDDFDEVRQLIAKVNARLNPFLEGRDQSDVGAQLQLKDVLGEVRLGPSAAEASRVAPKTRLESGAFLKTGIRSAALLNLFEGSSLQVNDQTEIEFGKLDLVTRSAVMTLNRGSFSLDQTGPRNTLHLYAQAQQFTWSDSGNFEVSLDPLGKLNYFAVYAGSAQWSGKSINGLIGSDQALWWGNTQQTIIDLPSRPELNSPNKHEVITLPPGERRSTVKFRWSSAALSSFQLQVSTDPQFLTRLFDQRGLDKGSFDLELDAGSYFWRVRGESKEHIPGAFSEVSGFTIKAGAVLEKAKPKEGPPLKIIKIELINNLAIVSGKTSARAYVSANSVKAVMNDDGTFRVIVNFARSGEQELEVVARDDQGGETISKHIVKVTSY
ncbi:MAG: DUF4398 domain-containing protein [Acidobacteria bacterium]|nr:DUF4398 domain-containing protein [Acidobacteriota bacterium]MCB9396983.1 DUF4398 domain-containing protein [Acidobacteriota bacterium]